MSSAKERMLNEVRQALKDVPENEDPQQLIIERNYQLESLLTEDECIELFAERVSEYKAKVTAIEEDELIKAISEACLKGSIKKLIVPQEIPNDWLPENLEILRDGDIHHTQNELDASDGVLTGCNLAIAQTGTIVLNGGPRQGRRILTLLPDYHLCVVFAKQIVGNVPEAYAALDSGIKESANPITFISGPSATSDIELDRVEGVHGPRRLEVLIVRG
ncbi:MAG: lactate utilization protein C [Balneolales bacterium]